MATTRKSDLGQTREQPGLKERRDFGENLRRARQTAQISQRAIARNTGLSQNWISKIEQGNANVGMETMAVLAQAVGVPVHKLMKPVARSSVCGNEEEP